MRLKDFIQDAAHQSRLSGNAITWLVLTPFISTFFSVLLIAHEKTRQVFVKAVSENNFVELLTFLLFIWGSILSFRLSTRCRVIGEPTFVSAFYFAYGIALFFIGMEEIAWGQWLIGFDTPEVIRQINAQGELTLHNLRSIQGGSVYFYLVFCVGATIGMYLNRYTVFGSIGAPVVIAPYLVVIVVFAFADWYTDHFWAPRGVAFAFDRISEVIEMLIGVVAVIYVWLNSRRLSMNRPGGMGSDFTS